MSSQSPNPTKRQLREQRRAEREAAEAAAAARSTRKRRAWIIGGAAVVAIVAVFAAALIASSGGDDSSDTSSQAESVTAADLSAFAGLQERNGVLGNPKAKVTLTEYLDLQCPICAQASTTTLPTIVRDYVRTGKVKLDVRTMHFIGDDSVRAARFAAGAERQGKLWPFIETFYANQGEENAGYATDAFLRGVAGAAGVNASAAFAQMNSAFAKSRLDRANADAARLGINGTPTFTVARDGATPRVVGSGAVDPSALASELDQELAG